MKRLAIITTHPIQYNAPWFRLLAERKNIEIKVFYTWSQVQYEEKFDPGFGKVIEWDIPLLEGYDYTFVNNVSKEPGSKTYWGIDNPTLIEEINAWKPDAVLVFGWKFKSHLKALRYFRKKIPVLFRGDSNLMNQPTGISKIMRNRILKNVFKNVDVALYVGTANKKYYEQFGLKKDQLYWAPHAVDNKRFINNVEDANTKASQYRKMLNISEKDIVFLYAGKFEPIKNPLFFLKVAKSMGMDNVHFVFVGSGPLEKEMKEHSSEHIHFLSFQNQNEMPVIYRIGDVIVLPSRSETWGLAVNEAMACSRPVLVSDQCGCAIDLVEDGVTGYVFQSNNQEDLQSKMELMAADKERLKIMGRNAFEKIQDWSFEKIAEAVEEVMTGISFGEDTNR